MMMMMMMSRCRVLSCQAMLDAIGRLLNGLPLGQQRVRAGLSVLTWLRRGEGLEGLFSCVTGEEQASLIQASRELNELARACAEGMDGRPWVSRYVMVRPVLKPLGRASATRQDADADVVVGVPGGGLAGGAGATGHFCHDEGVQLLRGALDQPRQVFQVQEQLLLRPRLPEAGAWMI
jgi:hypothetical protein